MTYLMVTIDTEEDNWSNYNDKPTLENIPRLTGLQDFFDRYKIKPTYLVTYPVATDPGSVSLLRRIMEDGKCEIGAHVHPWNTPPFPEYKTVENTMLCNLDKEVQYGKIASLHEAIFRSFGIEPVSFRSGRWGFDQRVAENLVRLGYRVDTSVSPYMNWSRYHGPDYSNCSPEPHYLQVGNGTGPDSRLLEVPATIGFLQKNYERSNRILNAVSGSRWKNFRIIGMLDRMGIVNKVMLSPETSSGTQMAKLCRSIRRKGLDLINMFFHSTSLQAGLTPFTKSREEEKVFMKRMEDFFEMAMGEGFRPIRLGEAVRFVPNGIGIKQ